MPRRLFFCHIPKTAGGSISRSIRDQYLPHEVLDFESAIELFDIRDDDLRDVYRCYLGHAGATFARRLPEDTVTVTLLRDPADRLLSLYNYFAERGVLNSEVSFEQFMTQPRYQEQVSNVMVWMMARDFGLGIRRRAHVQGVVEEMMEQALLNLKNFNLVGTYDQLGTFIERLNIVFSGSFSSLPKINVFEKIKNNLTSKEQDLVSSVCSIEYALYDLAKSVSESQWVTTLSCFKSNDPTNFFI